MKLLAKRRPERFHSTWKRSILHFRGWHCRGLQELLFHSLHGHKTAVLSGQSMATTRGGLCVGTSFNFRQFGLQPIPVGSPCQGWPRKQRRHNTVGFRSDRGLTRCDLAVPLERLPAPLDEWFETEVKRVSMGSAL